jgi:hypothetical protein
VATSLVSLTCYTGRNKLGDVTVQRLPPKQSTNCGPSSCYPKMSCIHRIVKLTNQFGSQFVIFRYNNLRTLFKHETLVVDTQLASRSPGCISLNFTIQTLTTCNQAFEQGNTQIKRQHFSTTLVARYTFFLAGDTNALARLLVSCSNGFCSTNDN